MAIQQAVLLIADIGGYTRFMTVHRINLAHAQDVVARLLESVIDAAGDFKLAKLEGDAAFFYAPVKDTQRDLSRLGAQVADIRRAFVQTRGEIEIDRMCTCDGCAQAKQLKLKFVAHVGEVAEQRVKRNRELAGVSVITVHRMLKNSVPVSEYVLVTDALYEGLAPELRAHAKAQTESLEGIGEVKTYYLDLDEMAEVQLPALQPSPWRRLRAWARLTLRSIPYFIGAKKACDGFRNMDAALGKTPELPPADHAQARPDPA